MVGNDSIWSGNPILWGPASNIHRTPYNARNVEYYSEDSVLSGMMADDYAKGAKTYGCVVMNKHFAFNDFEMNRAGVAPFMTEQATRENELRSFQIGVESGNVLGLMTSYNRVGACYSSTHTGLMQGILRDEWGYLGMTISDLCGDTDYMSALGALSAGTDMMLTRRMCGGWGLVEGCELNNPAGMRQVVERLAAYENSGMTPELAAKYAKYEEDTKSMMRDMRALADFKLAQADGRIAILPEAGKGFKPMVSDDPQDNVSTALNLFYAKDGMTWVRGGGPGPKYEDISLTDYVRIIAKEHNLEMAKDESDEEISFEMAELLFDGTGTMEGIVATLYTAAWAFSELRERLKGYEATRKTPDDLLQQMATPFGNDPFSMVWVAFKNLYPGKECEVFWDQHQEDEHREEYGFTNFPTDGSTPQVFVFAEHSVNTQTETFAHELAHVAVGPEHEHDDVWEAAFDAIFKEYNRLGDLKFATPDGKDGSSDSQEGK